MVISISIGSKAPTPDRYTEGNRKIPPLSLPHDARYAETAVVPVIVRLEKTFPPALPCAGVVQACIGESRGYMIRLMGSGANHHAGVI